MAMTRYEPWSILNQLHREMDRMFNDQDVEGGAPSATADWTPAVDIKEQADAFVLYADLPGVDPGSIDVNMENSVLTIKGERPWDNADERQQFKRTERVRGSFYRRFTLPDSADAERVSARSRNGVLEVVIPKAEKVQPRRINVEG